MTGDVNRVEGEKIFISTYRLNIWLLDEHYGLEYLFCLGYIPFVGVPFLLTALCWYVDAWPGGSHGGGTTTNWNSWSSTSLGRYRFSEAAVESYRDCRLTGNILNKDRFPQDGTFRWVREDVCRGSVVYSSGVRDRLWMEKNDRLLEDEDLLRQARRSIPASELLALNQLEQENHRIDRKSVV